MTLILLSCHEMSTFLREELATLFLGWWRSFLKITQFGEITRQRVVKLWCNVFIANGFLQRLCNSVTQTAFFFVETATNLNRGALKFVYLKLSSACKKLVLYRIWMKFGGETDKAGKEGEEHSVHTLFVIHFLGWQLLTDLMLSVLSLLMFLTDSAYGLYVTFSYCVTQKDLAACIWKAGESKCSSVCAWGVHIGVSYLYGCCCSIQWSVQGCMSVLVSVKLHLLTFWSTAWRYLSWSSGRHTMLGSVNDPLLNFLFRESLL